MSEVHMRRRVVRALKSADAVAVENPAHAGTPDVNFAEGWIELKVCASWPKRDSTPLEIPTFTPQQRAWLRRRWAAGGAVYMLLRVGREWILLAGDTAAELAGRATRRLLESSALWCGTQPTDEEIAECVLSAARSRTR